MCGTALQFTHATRWDSVNSSGDLLSDTAATRLDQVTLENEYSLIISFPSLNSIALVLPGSDTEIVHSHRFTKSENTGCMPNKHTNTMMLWLLTSKLSGKRIHFRIANINLKYSSSTNSDEKQTTKNKLTRKPIRGPKTRIHVLALCRSIRQQQQQQQQKKQPCHRQQLQQ